MSYNVVFTNSSGSDKDENWEGEEEEEAVNEVTPEHSIEITGSPGRNGKVSSDALVPIPPQALEVLDMIHEEPLPRTKAMAKVLSKLIPLSSMTDLSILTAVSCQTRSSLGTHFGGVLNSCSNMVAITSVPEVWSDPMSLGMGGVGKSTIAAMVASHDDVRRYFHDGIAWANVGSQEMNYTRYCTLLKKLCLQLTPPEDIPVFPVLVRTPCEPPSIRERREQGFMLYARDTVADFLETRRVLIILDNVEFQSDLDWFRFGKMPDSCDSLDSDGESPGSVASSPTVLVVTRRRDLVIPEDTVEIDLLYEAEAIRLMVTESGQTLDRSMAETREARMMVQLCADHPLAVKSVARWLSLKHAKSAETDSVQDSLEEVAHSIDKVIEQSSDSDKRCDTMFEILSMAFAPAVNGKPTVVIKFCFAAFCTVFGKEEYHSLFTSLETQPMIPMPLSEMLFKAVLKLEEEKLSQEGTLFYSQLRDATMLIPEALSALGVMKVFHHHSKKHDMDSDEESEMSSLASVEEPNFVQIVHSFFQEYGEYLTNEAHDLKDLTSHAELLWNREFCKEYLATSPPDWSVRDASRDYAVEMIVSHMLRGELYEPAYTLLTDKEFVRARLESMGRENATRQHITDCEALYEVIVKGGIRNKRPRAFMEQAYQILGDLLILDDNDSDGEDELATFVETGHAQYEIGLSLAEKRYWSAAIAHWETSQEILVSSMGVEEFVAAVLYNTGVAYAEINKHKKALSFLKRCLQIRGAIHGEHHTLFAQTIQKIGDLFLAMSDYSEAMDCYSLALGVMYVGPNYHRLEIGDILQNMGNIHYGKGEVLQALKCYQDALRSKKLELGQDHPELASAYEHVGNCLSDESRTEEAIIYFEEAIRLRKLDPVSGDEQDADILSIEGVLNNLRGNQELGLQCYETCLDILVTKIPHKKGKIAGLMHLIGCVYLMNGKHDKAMEHFEASLEARKKIHGLMHLEVASTLFNIAFVHQLCGQLEKALEFLEEALKTRERLLPDSEKVALTQEKIGILLTALGNKEQAGTAFQEALRIRKSIFGNDHELVASVLHELGDLADDSGDYDEAVRCFTEALDIRRVCLGSEHEDVASTLYSMAFALHHQGESEPAFECFEEALDIRRALLGEDSQEAADALNMMGFLLAQRGDSEEALTYLWDALRIRKLNEDVVSVAEILMNVGNVHRQKGEHELAVECYEECLRISREKYGNQDEKVADALLAIGNVRRDMENNIEATEAYGEALRILTLVYGKNDGRLTEVHQSIGLTELRSGNCVNAQLHLEEYFRIRRESQEAKDEEFVNVLCMMGNIHKLVGRDVEAKKCWSEANQVFQELNLVDSNPELETKLKDLLLGDSTHSSKLDERMLS